MLTLTSPLSLYMIIYTIKKIKNQKQLLYTKLPNVRIVVENFRKTFLLMMNRQRKKQKRDNLIHYQSNKINQFIARVPQVGSYVCLSIHQLLNSRNVKLMRFNKCLIQCCIGNLLQLKMTNLMIILHHRQFQKIKCPKVSILLFKCGIPILSKVQ